MFPKRRKTWFLLTSIAIHFMLWIMLIWLYEVRLATPDADAELFYKPIRLTSFLSAEKRKISLPATSSVAMITRKQPFRSGERVTPGDLQLSSYTPAIKAQKALPAKRALAVEKKLSLPPGIVPPTRKLVKLFAPPPVIFQESSGFGKKHFSGPLTRQAPLPVLAAAVLPRTYDTPSAVTIPQEKFSLELALPKEELHKGEEKRLVTAEVGKKYPQAPKRFHLKVKPASSKPTFSSIKELTTVAAPAVPARVLRFALAAATPTLNTKTTAVASLVQQKQKSYVDTASSSIDLTAVTSNRAKREFVEQQPATFSDNSSQIKQAITYFPTLAASSITKATIPKSAPDRIKKLTTVVAPAVPARVLRSSLAAATPTLNTKTTVVASLVQQKQKSYLDTAYSGKASIDLTAATSARAKQELGEQQPASFSDNSDQIKQTASCSSIVSTGSGSAKKSFQIVSRFKKRRAISVWPSGKVSFRRRQLVPETVAGLNPAPRVWTTYINDSLIMGEINAIVVDKHANKWLGVDAGVIKFDGRRWRSYTQADGLVNNKVQDIAIDSQGNKWFATEGGVSKFDGVNWTTYTSNDGLASNNVYAVAVDSAGCIWFGTDSGLSSFDGRHWTTYTTSNGLLSNHIYCVAIANNGSLWCGSDKGLNHFDGQSWSSYTTVDGLINNYIYTIAVARSGEVWVGTTSGVSRFYQQQWTNYEQQDGLLGERVYTIAVAKDGQKWFGSDGGLTRYDDHHWVQYTSKNGLLGQQVYTITVEEKTSSQWVATEMGISCLSQF